MFLFVLLIGVVLWQHPFSIPQPGFQDTSSSNIGLAIYTIMWNFLGWDNCTSYAQEVRRPVRSYLLSVTIAFVLILIIYALAMYAAVKTGISADLLQEQGFPAVALIASGKWLAMLVAAGGMAGALGMYSGVLLSVSRIPEVMAKDNLLPQKLKKLHHRHGTPYISIVTCSLIVSVMILLTFESLIIIDVTLYGAALSLEYIALIRLRQMAAAAVRPFKIPLNTAGLILMALLPASVYGIAICTSFISGGHAQMPVLLALATLLSAPLVWWLVRRRRLCNGNVS